MTGRKFLIFIGFAFVLALALYLLTTPRGSDIPLIGVVDGNEVIVSPQITGRSWTRESSKRASRLPPRMSRACNRR